MKALGIIGAVLLGALIIAAAIGFAVLVIMPDVIKHD